MKIPRLGMATFEYLEEHENNPGYDYVSTNKVKDAVSAALKHGYTHIDISSWGDDEDEKEIGEALSKRNREDLFIVGHIWHLDVNDPMEVLTDLLKYLGTEYLDLWLLEFAEEGYLLKI